MTGLITVMHWFSNRHTVRIVVLLYNDAIGDYLILTKRAGFTTLTLLAGKSFATICTAAMPEQLTMETLAPTL